MDPLGCLIGFCQIFVKKFEKLNESEIQVSEREGYDILHYSLPEYRRMNWMKLEFKLGIIKNYGSNM